MVCSGRTTENSPVIYSRFDAGQFIPVWCSATEQWVSPAEQAAALLASLPEEAARQVLDFACFLSWRVSGSSAVKAG